MMKLRGLQIAALPAPLMAGACHGAATDGMFWAPPPGSAKPRRGWCVRDIGNLPVAVMTVCGRPETITDLAGRLAGCHRFHGVVVAGERGEHRLVRLKARAAPSGQSCRKRSLAGWLCRLPVRYRVHRGRGSWRCSAGWAAGREPSELSGAGAAATGRVGRRYELESVGRRVAGSWLAPRGVGTGCRWGRGCRWICALPTGGWAGVIARRTAPRSPAAARNPRSWRSVVSCRRPRRVRHWPCG